MGRDQNVYFLVFVYFFLKKKKRKKEQIVQQCLALLDKSIGNADHCCQNSCSGIDKAQDSKGFLDHNITITLNCAQNPRQQELGLSMYIPLGKLTNQIKDSK